MKVLPIDSIKKVASETPSIPSDADLEFETFIDYFNKDSLFQISRIDFPLKVKELNDDFELAEQLIQKLDFKKIDFSYDKSKANKMVDNYKQNIKVKGNKAVTELRGIDNGIIADYYFEKEKGKWMLKTWINSST